MDLDLGEAGVDGVELVVGAERGSPQLGDGAAGVGQLSGLGAGRRDEEVGDRHVEHHRQQVELVGVEAPPPFAVEASLHGRDRRLRELVTGELCEPVGDGLLGHAPPLPDGLDVVGDDGVHVEAGRSRRR